MAKKTFKEDMKRAALNPALSFLSGDEAARDQAAGQDEERKSKRLNLLIRPGLYRDALKIATMERTSINEIVNRSIAEYAERRAELVKKYDEVFHD